MKLVPAAGPDRTRLIVLLVFLGLAGAAWYYRTSTAEPAPPPAVPGGRTASGVPTAPRDTAAAANARQAAPRPTSPQALKLAELEKVPDEPEAGRNPFRFGVRVIPPPPAPPQPPYVAPIPTAPPTPPPPMVQLRLSSVIDDPYVPGRHRGYFVDPTGAMFEAVDGQVVDGRYRVVKVEKTSAIVEFVDGSGRRTLFIR